MIGIQIKEFFFFFFYRTRVRIATNWLEIPKPEKRCQTERQLVDYLHHNEKCHLCRRQEYSVKPKTERGDSTLDHRGRNSRGNRGTAWGWPQQIPFLHEDLHQFQCQGGGDEKVHWPRWRSLGHGGPDETRQSHAKYQQLHERRSNWEVSWGNDFVRANFWCISNFYLLYPNLISFKKFPLLNLC